MQLSLLSGIVFLLILSLWVIHHDPFEEGIGEVPADIIPITALKDHSGLQESIALSPKELMSRPLSTDRTEIPKLFHQSWKDANPPEKYEAWIRSCRTLNSDWESVLWTDEDNLQMVKKYAPWFLDTFNDLPEPIERADASRNLYMHIFGGVYADLDTECLRPYNTLFSSHGVPAVSHLQSTANQSHAAKSSAARKAFLGKMHPDKNFHSGLPNAWMASTPAHPFWTLPLEYVSAHSSDSKTPEFLTGPDALFEIVKVYKKQYASKSGAELDEHHKQSSWSKIHDSDPNAMPPSSPQSLEVLSPLWVFPFNWANVPLRPACWAGGKKFDAETCKDLLDVERKGSYSISYFGHSWDGDPFYNR